MPTAVRCAPRSLRHERGMRRAATDATANAMTSATDHLAHTRRAIIAELHGAGPRSGSGSAAGVQSLAGSPAGKTDFGQRGWWGKLQRAARMWWRRHPASTGLELARPVMANYAAQKPVRFLAIAAAAGAAIVVARGWRLISIAGLLGALIKATPLSSFALAALAATEREQEDPDPTGE